MSILQAARRLKRDGLEPIPLPIKEKRPILKGWPTLRLTEAEIEHHFKRNCGVGVLLGKASGGAIDIDLDVPEARLVAKYFLPSTRRIHGRPSAPESHFFYRCVPPPKPEKFLDVDGTCLAEIRSDGQQTIVPPSLHPSGERLTWKLEGELTSIAADELRADVVRLVACVLLARHWPAPGGRHQASLGLGGLLLRHGWSETEVRIFVGVVARAAGDEEWKSRKSDVASTARRIKDGKPATGIPRLSDLVGGAVVNKVLKLLDVDPSLEIHPNRPLDDVDWPEDTENLNAASIVMTAEGWLTRQPENVEPLMGTTKHQIVRCLTKNLILGPEKSLKTTFTERLMLGLSCGDAAFPALPVPGEARVLYLHGELSPDEISDRTRAAAQGLHRPLDNFIQGRDFRLHLAEPRGQATLANLLKEYEPEVLVLDPLQCFISGLDENTYKDMSKVMRYLDRVIATYKVTIFLDVHTGKDRGRGIRGHSCFSGWRDTLFVLSFNRQKGSLTVNIEPRWARSVEPFNLKFRDGTLFPTEESSFSGQTQKILEIVRGKGGSVKKSEVGKQLELNADALRQALKRAEQAGAIKRRGSLVELAE